MHHKMSHVERISLNFNKVRHAESALSSTLAFVRIFLHSKGDFYYFMCRVVYCSYKC